MSEEEKKAIETVEGFIKYYKNNEQTGNRANLDVLREECKAIEFVLNKYDVTQKELNNLKKIEQQHQEENEKLRVELEQEKEKNKELQKQLNGAFDRGFISKDKIKEKIEKFRCETTWGYNEQKYDEKIYYAEHKIIDMLEKELLEEK